MSGPAPAPAPVRAGDAALLLLLLAALPLLGHQFGYGNQVEQFPIVARILDPGYLPRDFYVDATAGFGPRFYYAHGLAALAAHLPLPAVVLVLGLATDAALAFLAHQGARRFLGASRTGGLLAAALVVTNGGITLGLAGFLRFDSFQPASVAIPLALGGLHLLLLGRPFAAAPLFVLSALAHPLIGTEAALLAHAAVAGARLLGAAGPSGSPAETPAARLRAVLPVAAAGGLALLAIALAWVLPAAGAGGERLSDAEFFAILAELRAPHHYLGLRFPAEAWAAAAAFAAGGAMLLAGPSRRPGPARTLALLAVLVLLLVPASLVLVDLLAWRPAVTAQTFRLLFLAKWVVALALGALLGRWISAWGWPAALWALPLLVASRDALPWALLLVLAARAATLPRGALALRLPPALRPVLLPALVPAAAGAATLVALLLARRYGQEQEVFRGAAAALVLGLAGLGARAGAPAMGRAAATLAILALLGFQVWQREAGMFGRRGLRAEFGWADLTGEEVTLARRVAAETDPASLWIVPPGFERFRLLAGRAVVADFTSIPFGDAAMREWRTRMERLYGPLPEEALRAGGFAALKAMRETHRSGRNIRSAAAAYGADHAVLLAETPWDGPVLFAVPPWKVVRIPVPGPAVIAGPARGPLR